MESTDPPPQTQFNNSADVFNGVAVVPQGMADCIAQAMFDTGPNSNLYPDITKPLLPKIVLLTSNAADYAQECSTELTSIHSLTQNVLNTQTTISNNLTTALSKMDQMITLLTTIANNGSGGSGDVVTAISDQTAAMFGFLSGRFTSKVDKNSLNPPEVSSYQLSLGEMFARAMFTTTPRYLSPSNQVMEYLTVPVSSILAPPATVYNPTGTRVFAATSNALSESFPPNLAGNLVTQQYGALSDPELDPWLAQTLGGPQISLGPGMPFHFPTAPAAAPSLRTVSDVDMNISRTVVEDPVD